MLFTITIINVHSLAITFSMNILTIRRYIAGDILRPPSPVAERYVIGGPTELESISYLSLVRLSSFPSHVNLWCM